jgi:hypothetical protein
LGDSYGTLLIIFKQIRVRCIHPYLFLVKSLLMS